MARTEAPEGHREGCGIGGANIQLRGLDTKQLKGSLVVLYAPAGNSCFLRLVGYVMDDRWMGGWMMRERASDVLTCWAVFSCLIQFLSVEKF